MYVLDKLANLARRIVTLEEAVIDEEPTKDSTNAVSSGGVYTALDNLKGGLETSDDVVAIFEAQLV